MSVNSYPVPEWLESAVSGFQPGSRVRLYRKGEIIFPQGEEADSLGVILDGLVKLTRVSNVGREAVVGIMRSPDIIGEECILENRSRTSSAVAMSSGAMMTLSKGEVLRASSSARFASHLAGYLVSRRARIEEDLVSQIFNCSEKRLARIIINLAGEDASGDNFFPIPRISQETLAMMVGTTRSRISFFMNRFRKNGDIRYNNSIEVNPARLQRLHSIPANPPAEARARAARS